MSKIIVLICILTICTTALGQLSGLKTVGVGGDYATLTIALNTWKTSTIAGDVIFQLLDTAYQNETYPLLCTIPAGYSGGNWRLTIKPASGIVSHFDGTNSIAIFDLNGIDRLTIDSLYISNRNAGTDSAGSAVRIINGASQNIIKNSTLKASCRFLSSLSGGVVYIATAEGTAGPGNNDNLIDNCEICHSRDDQFPVFGVCVRGTSPMYTRTNNNNTVLGCKIHDFERHGVYFSAYDSNTTIANNEFYSTVAQNTSILYGIRITATSISNTKILGNKFYNLKASGPSPVIMGIYMTMASGTNPPLVANNFFSLDAETTHDNARVYAIYHMRQQAVTDTYKFYYNSIYIGGNVTSGWSYGFFMRTQPSQSTKVDFRNNIVFNNRQGGSGNYCVFDSLGGADFTCDYNDLYVSTPGTGSQYIGYYSGANVESLALWRTMSGHDPHSISANPDFLSPLNLHINPASSIVNNLGTYINRITDDIDGESRNLTTPDIGADEYTPGAAYEEPVVKLPTIRIENIYPNPFRRVAMVNYNLSQAGHVCIKIYSNLGREIKTLVNQYKTAGEYNICWDGKNNNGATVSNGVYIVRITSDKCSYQSRLIMIK